MHFLFDLSLRFGKKTNLLALTMFLIGSSDLVSFHDSLQKDSSYKTCRRCQLVVYYSNYVVLQCVQNIFNILFQIRISNAKFINVCKVLFIP